MSDVRFPAEMRFTDALAGANTDDGEYVLTSPNMDFVPEPVMGRI